jgi:hypothetical protein
MISAGAKHLITREFPDLFISYAALRALERVLRKDRLDWRIAAYTRGDIPGADYWGIDD